MKERIFSTDSAGAIRQLCQPKFHASYENHLKIDNGFKCKI